MQITIDTGLSGRLLQFVTDRQAIQDLHTYYQDGPSSYTGRWFERIGTPEEQHRNRNRLTSDDIVALSALSVRLPITVSARLLGTDAAEISKLLTDIPADVDLWSASRAHLGPKSAAFQLFMKLRAMAWNGGEHGTAWVTAHKLLARKRPRLIPMYDAQVRGLVDLGKGADWWISLQSALTPQIRDHLIRAHKAAELDPTISSLRTLDVILWMRARRTTVSARAS
ncbi:MAG TPA: DUF6308 family protein [Kribbella sp.]